MHRTFGALEEKSLCMTESIGSRIDGSDLARFLVHGHFCSGLHTFFPDDLTGFRIRRDPDEETL